jgi:hypothetical protein
MGKGESVASYLTRVAQVKDESVAVGEVIPDSELERIALKGFTKEWEVFMKCVVGREHLPYWSRLWDDFTQEEIRERSQAVDRREIELMKRMLLLRQREKVRSRGAPKKN